MRSKPLYSPGCDQRQGASFDASQQKVKGILWECLRWMAVVVWAVQPISPGWAQENTGLSLEVIFEPGAQFSSGHILASPRFTSNETYPIVVDADGSILHNDLNPFRGFNFEQHPDGQLAWFWTMEGVWEVLDSSMQVVESIDFVDADVDYHELELMPNGHRMLLGQEIITVTLPDSVPDLDDPDRALIDCLLQEQDALGNVIWSWRASDHIPPTWCTHCFWSASLIDAYHHNAFQILDNGDILLCLRNMDAVVRINRLTGEVLWVAGGPMSDFSFSTPGTAFKHPHDAQLVDDNHLLLFDNGTGKSPLVSRGVEYILDLESGALVQVQEWIHPYGNYASSQGSIQRLESGGTLIGWGTGASDLTSGGLITEYDAQGNLLGSIHCPSNHFSYRARKVLAEEIPLIQGCRESGACNYDAAAALNGDCIQAGDPCDDGDPCTAGDIIQESCNCSGQLPPPDAAVGCSDPAAANFDACAWPDVDDGACQYAVEFRVDATSLAPLPTSMTIWMNGSPYALQPGGFGTWKGTLSLGSGLWQYHYQAGAVADTVMRYLDLSWPVSGPLTEQRACFGLPEVACPGCTDPDDPSFSPFAMDDALCGTGPWLGCMEPSAVNYDAMAAFDDGSCVFIESNACPADLDADGLVSVADILILLTYFGSACSD